jgi:hypothetical protein
VHGLTCCTTNHGGGDATGSGTDVRRFIRREFIVLPCLDHGAADAPVGGAEECPLDAGYSGPEDRVGGSDGADYASKEETGGAWMDYQSNDR